MNRKERRAKALPAFRKACVKYRLARAKAIMEIGLNAIHFECADKFSSVFDFFYAPTAKAECVKDVDAFLQKVKGIKRPVFADFCKAEI